MPSETSSEIDQIASIHSRFLTSVIREQGIRLTGQIELATVDLAAVLFVCTAVYSLRSHIWGTTLAICALVVLWDRWRRRITDRMIDAERELWHSHTERYEGLHLDGK